MAFTLKRPRAGRKFWTVEIRLPGQSAVERSTQCERKSDARAVAERLHSEAAAQATRVTLLNALETLIGLRVRQKRSAATISIYEEKGAQLLRFFGEQRDVGTLRLADTTAYVAHRREGKRAVSDSTIAKEMGVLRSALRYLVRLEMYTRPPDALWPPELPHGSGVCDRWLPWDEYLKVLQALPPEWREAFTVYCQTGVRYRELYRLEARDVGELLAIRGTKSKGAVRPVPITADVRDILARRSEASPTGPLWPYERQDDSQRTRWLKVLSLACERAGVAHASTNDLRRTFASWCWQQAVPEALVIKWLGHSSSKMVRRVYAQPSTAFHVEHGARIPSRTAAK